MPTAWSGEMLPCVGFRRWLCNGEGREGSVLLEKTSRSLHQPCPRGDEQQTLTGCPRERLQIRESGNGLRWKGPEISRPGKKKIRRG